MVETKPATRFSVESGGAVNGHLKPNSQYHAGCRLNAALGTDQRALSSSHHAGIKLRIIYI